MYYVGEVVLGEHGVGGISRPVVVEDNVLLPLAALDNLLRAGRHLILNLLNNRQDEGGDLSEDELGELLLELLDDLGQDGDLVESSRQALHKFVVPLDDGHNVLEDTLDIGGEFLGLLGGDLHVLHLRVGAVLLDLVQLVALVLAAEEAVRDLVEKVPKNARVVPLALLEGSLELLQLVLLELVRNWSMCENRASPRGTLVNSPSPVTEWRKSTPPKVPVTRGYTLLRAPCRLIWVSRPTWGKTSLMPISIRASSV
jgi:hypothetical protein